MPDRFIPSPCHNFGCVSSEVSDVISYLQIAKPWHFNQDIDKHNLLKEAFLLNEKWRYLLRNMFTKQNLSYRCGWKYSHKQAHWPRSSTAVGQKIPLLTTQVGTLAADRHVIAKLPLYPFWIIKLTCLPAGICMKVRFKPKVTRSFSFSPLCDSCATLHGSFAALSCSEKSTKTSGTREHVPH